MLIKECSTSHSGSAPSGRSLRESCSRRALRDAVSGLQRGSRFAAAFAKATASQGVKRLQAFIIPLHSSANDAAPYAAALPFDAPDRT
jgi:hypothetical protein